MNLPIQYKYSCSSSQLFYKDYKKHFLPPYSSCTCFSEHTALFDCIYDQMLGLKLGREGKDPGLEMGL